jgi:ribosome-associated protein
MPDEPWIDAGPDVRIPRAELVYRATPAGGPGGQHVNRVATRIELWWNVAATVALSAPQRAVVRDRLTGRIDGDGWLRIVAADSRSQARNREAATGRLGALVAAALKPRKKRKATRVSPAQKRARLEAKRRRSEAKRLRGRVRPDD